MSSSTRTLAAGAALLLVGSLAPSLAAPPQRDAERGVRRALIRLNQLLAGRDLAIVDEFARGEDTLLVGSLASDRARGRAELEAHFRRYFERPETFSLSWREVEVAVRGSVAWLHAEGELILRGDETERREPYRLTGVLELHAGKWLWRLFHGSQPAA
jgi:ketosteroid isomerase-like protein